MMADVTYVPPTANQGVPARLRLTYIADTARRYVGRLSAILSLLVVAGLAEGLGIATLLPLLSILTENAGSERSTLEILTLRIFDAVGLDPTIGVLLAVTVSGIAIKAVLIMVSMSLVGIVMAQIATDLRLGFLRSIFAANWLYFTSTPIGNITNAMSRESDKAAALLGMFTRMAAGAVQVMVLLTLAALVSWQITAAAISAGMLLFVLLNRVVGAARRAGRQEANAYASLSRQMSDAVQGIKAIKAMALERRVAPLLEREMGEINSALRRNAVASEALRSLQEPILVALMAIGLYALVVYAERPIESLIVMALLFQRSAGMIGQVQQAYQKTVAHEGFFVHMVERTRLAEDAAERNNGTRSPTLDQGLEFRNVSFSYGSHPALDTISTRLESGKIYALVGPSGSGKTTFVDLVLGFHRATSGQVLIDGVPIEEIDIGKWRSLVGYVPQELFLFHDTIRKNITLGANVTDEDVDRCIDAARARTFIETLPNGLETVVGERGSKLSGGQRQRIAIARALLHAPRLLVLDEPTTALDPETEAGVSATLENLKGQVTVLLISHQAALSRIADHVLELRQGRLSATRSRDTAPRSNVDGRPGSGP